MEKNSTTKTLTLSLAIIILWLSLYRVHFGIYAHCPISSRLLYSFFHASFFHALTNVWCLLSLVFINNMTLRDILIAYLIALSFPVDTLCPLFPILHQPTVGLSGLCFALFGIYSSRVYYKWRFHLYIIFFLALTSLAPQLNTPLHLWSYLVGILFSHLPKIFFLFKRYTK